MSDDAPALPASVTMTITARCPGSCGRVVQWIGTPAPFGSSGTDWRIADHEGCGTASSDKETNR